MNRRENRRYAKAGAPKGAHPFYTLLYMGAEGRPIDEANQVVIINTLAFFTVLLAGSFSVFIFAHSRDWGILVAGAAEVVLFSGLFLLNFKGYAFLAAASYIMVHNIALFYFAVLRNMLAEEVLLWVFLLLGSVLIFRSVQQSLLSVLLSTGILAFAWVNGRYDILEVVPMDGQASGPFQKLGAIALGSLIVVMAALFKWQLLSIIQALRRHNETLESQVQERTRELQQVNKELDEANSQLAAANRNLRLFHNQFSHDTRDTLNAMQSMTSLLLEEQQDKETQEATYARHLFMAVSRLATMGEDILEEQRIEEKQHDELFIQTIDTHNWLAELVAVTRYNAAIRKIEVFTDFEPQMPDYIDTDPVKLGRILDNLLGNALRHARTMVVFRAYTTEKHLMLEINDNGPGIPEDKRSSIFERNYTTGSGSGLGLYIVRHLCLLMHIILEPKSDEQNGTSFLLKVPYTKAKKQPPKPEDAEDIAAEFLSGKRILLAEDEPTNRLALRINLERYGCKVVEASDGAQVLIKAKLQQPDLIILDNHMPVLSGIETLNRIRATHSLSAIPVILMTASASESGELLQTDADDVQYKPLSINKLMASISSLLQGAREHSSGNGSYP